MPRALKGKTGTEGREKQSPALSSLEAGSHGVEALTQPYEPI